MQLEIINILDEILQKKKLKLVLEYDCSDAIFNSLKDPNTGRSLENKIKEFFGENSSAKHKDIKSALETKFMDYVDYTAGISVGATNGCTLTICNEIGDYKYTTKDIINQLDPAKFLVKTPWHNFKTKFEQSELEKAISSFLGNATFDDLKKSKLITISYNIACNKQTIFTNFFDKDSQDKTPNFFQRHVDVKKSCTTLTDAAVASASAEIAFPAKKMSYTLMNGDKIKDTYEIDGGNIRNTPMLEAISTLVINPGIDMKDLVVISIGTGTTDFDMSDLKDCSTSVYLKNITRLGGDSFINANILCNASSIKDIVADLITDAGGQFYNVDMRLDRDLFKMSFDPSLGPKYKKAAQDAFAKGTDGYKQLEDLTDYLISLEV